MPEDEDAAEGPVEDGARGGQRQERLDGQIVMEQRQALVEGDHGRPSDAHHRAHHLGHPMPPAQVDLLEPAQHKDMLFSEHCGILNSSEQLKRSLCADKLAPEDSGHGEGDRRNGVLYRRGVGW